MEKLVLDEKAIDKKLMLFRAAQYPEVFLVRRELAKEIEAEKFTGVTLTELDDFEFFGKG